MRYLNQRYTMTDRNVAGCLTDIGTEELAHMEIIGAILHQLTRNLTMDQIEKSPFAAYFVDHTTGVWPSAASGMPFSAATFQCTGDPIADLTEDMAAEQKARITYDNILRLVDDPEVRGSHQIPAGAGDRPLPALWRVPAPGDGLPGQQELLRL